MSLVEMKEGINVAGKVCGDKDMFRSRWASPGPGGIIQISVSDVCVDDVERHDLVMGGL